MWLPTVLCLAMLAVPGLVQAVTIRIPADQPTIQAGIAAAGQGDTVLVSPGTYTETIHDGFLGKSIVTRSAEGPLVTTIRASQEEAITFSAGEGPGAVLEGFTLTDGSSGGLRILIANDQGLHHSRLLERGSIWRSSRRRGLHIGRKSSLDRLRYREQPGQLLWRPPGLSGIGRRALLWWWCPDSEPLHFHRKRSQGSGNPRSLFWRFWRWAL